MLNTTPETPQPAIPLHQHGAFDDIEAALRLIDHARDALLGIGELLQPETVAQDRQLNNAHSSNAAAIFLFFGEVLAEPVEIISNATYRLQAIAKDKGGWHEQYKPNATLR